MRKKRKQAVTLIEIMIVIVLISLIGGALAYNMRGSMDKGKVFKTKQNISRIYDILTLESVEKNIPLREVCTHWQEVVNNSPLVKGSDLINDAWGKEFNVTYDRAKDDIKISSEGLANWEKNCEKK